MASNPWAFAFTPGINKRSCYLDSACTVTRSQYAHLFGEAMPREDLLTTPLLVDFVWQLRIARRRGAG